MMRMVPFKFCPLLIVCFFLLLLFSTGTAIAHPAPSGSSVTCHGPLPGVRYTYRYSTHLQLNNALQLEPAGFSLLASVSIENVWQDRVTYLAEVHLDSVKFVPRPSSTSARFTAGPVITTWPVVLANVEGATGQVRALYVAKDKWGHASGHLLEPTHLNLLVSLLNSLRSRFAQVRCFDDA